MSLTSFLQEPEVKRLFTNSFKIPKEKIKCEIRAPLLTKKYSLVGTAFDYLMRFHLKYHNSDAIMKRWVAEGACDLMEVFEPEDVYTKAKSELDFATELYRKFLDDGILTGDLIVSSMMLAHLDIYFRAGRNAYNIPMQIESNDIQDLQNLINLVDFNLFKAKSHCFLNPTFNQASQLVGGADADFVIDNMLIDIKTTKDPTIKIDMFNQIIGYYLLGLMGGIGEENIDGSTIKKIGFYFSRHGVLHLYKVEDIVDFEKLPDIMEQFESMALELFPEEERELRVLEKQG